jgi:hypothetical protein
MYPHRRHLSSCSAERGCLTDSFCLLLLLLLLLDGVASDELPATTSSDDDIISTGLIPGCSSTDGATNGTAYGCTCSTAHASSDNDIVPAGCVSSASRASDGADGTGCTRSTSARPFFMPANGNAFIHASVGFLISA